MLLTSYVNPRIPAALYADNSGGLAYHCAAKAVSVFKAEDGFYDLEIANVDILVSAGKLRVLSRKVNK